MINVLSVENMRKSDAYTIENLIPGKELMFRAGKGVFESVKWQSPVGIVCGSGNNAGDGYVIAKLLHDADIECDIILLAEKFSADGEHYYNICKAAGVPVKLWKESFDLSSYETIVDCILGTGFKGTARGKAKEAIEAINNCHAYIISVDINSGLNGDSGVSELCVKSDITVSVGGFKPGHFLNMAKDVMRNKVNCDIGIDPVDRAYHLIEASDLTKILHPRKNFSHKGTYGYIALIGGSMKYGGAIRLANLAAAGVRSGAGVVKLAFPQSIYHEVAPNTLESTLFPLSEEDGEIKFVEKEISELVSNVKTVAFGMGVGTSKNAALILDYLLRSFDGRLIIDADGLNVLATFDRNTLRHAAGQIVLTPHVKEFSRISGVDTEEIMSSPISIAETYAKENGVVLLLKGPSTVVTDGEETYIIDAGCAGMATAGSGDVLSGIIAAIEASSNDCLLGAAAAAYVNGKAGEAAQKEMGSISMQASDTVAKIADIISKLEGMN